MLPRSAKNLAVIWRHSRHRYPQASCQNWWPKLRHIIFRYFFTIDDYTIKWLNPDTFFIHIQKQLTDELTGPVESLLEAAENNTWPSLRKLVKYKSKDAVFEFSNAVASFELDGSKIDRMVQTLRKHARNVVEKKAREAAAADKTLPRMKDRWST